MIEQVQYGFGYRNFFFFFSSRRRHTRCREVSWARRCVQETGIRAYGGCLGISRRRKTRQAAISFGERQTRFDPEISEWGNPAEVMLCHLSLNKIGLKSDTQGSETSQYLQEKKIIMIPQVVASERGRVQTSLLAGWGCGTTTQHSEQIAEPTGKLVHRG
eukprot:TRINITY_DN2508_c0_g1_i9.p4 TRINITY_DN2508_c0_g1~~TRINITY_DN2508_c0_g1_i9.p4  ORF type:complete len:160 (+),score=21.06 TRINITY_DN2508_c0_g1_i9:103-582(+)